MCATRTRGRVRSFIFIVYRIGAHLDYSVRKITSNDVSFRCVRCAAATAEPSYSKFEFSELRKLAACPYRSFAAPRALHSLFVGAYIPYLGAFLSGAVAVLVALADRGIVIALWAVGVVLAVQVLEGHVLQPLIQSRTVQMHPAVIMIALTAGAGVAGNSGGSGGRKALPCGRRRVGREWRHGRRPRTDLTPILTPSPQGAPRVTCSPWFQPGIGWIRRRAEDDATEPVHRWADSRDPIEPAWAILNHAVGQTAQVPAKVPDLSKCT